VEDLRIGIEDDFDEMGEMFDQIAEKVRLRHLKHLRLEGMECDGDSMQVFLGKHTSLQTLDMRWLNIIGELDFGHMLKVIEEHFDCLQRATFQHIAQGCQRIAFETLGDVDSYDYHFSGTTQQREIFDDFVELHGPFRHRTTVEDWEGLKHRLSLLREDYVVLDRTHLSRGYLDEPVWHDDEQLGPWL